jgi:AmmeMemoRadiSam system protein A
VNTTIDTLSRTDREALLSIARSSIQEGERDPPHVSPAGSILKEAASVFVTLTKRGVLRGCIGHTEPRWPLAEAVARMAWSAAYSDSRFPPVEPSEFPELEIEISILTPFEEVRNIDEIAVGEDGLVVENGFQRGLLLPQVPVPRGWNRIEFLAHTCKKAGLDDDAWKDPETKIYRFQAYVFGEREE